MKKLFCIFCCIALSIPMCSCTLKPINILDSGGEVYESPKSANSASPFSAYAINEAAAILADKENISEADAKKRLFSGGYEILTTCDSGIAKSISEIYKQKGEETAFACSVLNKDGELVALFGGEDYDPLERKNPHSSIKPLSVYAPAIESGKINWSTKFTDSPYKQITEKNGTVSDWPKNASGKYTEEDMFIAQAIGQSTNTVAVKCLKAAGVSQSVDFLESKLGFNLSAEKSRMALGGEDEILGNIALGEISNGVTVTEMAGYYRIFDGSGQYLSPTAVLEIRKDGEVIYTCAEREKPIQAISEQTSGIMNMLLREPLKNGGTASAAGNTNIAVAGKTGTGDDAKWFCSLTPEYSVAVWHGGDGKNTAPEIFAEILKELPHSKTEFPLTGISKKIICQTSGDAYSLACGQMTIGYYADGTVLSKCKLHSNK